MNIYLVVVTFCLFYICLLFNVKCCSFCCFVFLSVICVFMNLLSCHRDQDPLQRIFIISMGFILAK